MACVGLAKADMMYMLRYINTRVNIALTTSACDKKKTKKQKKNQIDSVSMITTGNVCSFSNFRLSFERSVKSWIFSSGKLNFIAKLLTFWLRLIFSTPKSGKSVMRTHLLRL